MGSFPFIGDDGSVIPYQMKSMKLLSFLYWYIKVDRSIRD